MSKYDDIINMPHHTSEKRPHMSLHDRAAQFSPFAALTGYDGAISESVRLTDEKIELDDGQIARINERIVLLSERRDTPTVSVTYFVPDERKSGGAYVTYTGDVKRVDDGAKELVFTDKKRIPFCDIIAIECSTFTVD